MLSNLPFQGDFPIVQQFGDSPRTFRRVRCDGAALRGHHGIDFGMPVGVPVLAVSDGVAAAVNTDSDGFGKSVLLEHHWGQTLYAHLSEFDIDNGTPVQAGQEIGRSGNSGLCLYPHLHFGLRVNPYALEDRWCGYTDPAPYLFRIAVGRGPIVGPHIIGGIPVHLNLLRRWQPRLIVVLDPNPDEMRLLRQACPNSVIVGRVFAPDHLVVERIRSGPRAAARWAHDQTLPRVSEDVDYWQFANEVLQDESGLSLLNQFELARMQLAESAGYACSLFGFSVGNPDLPEDYRMARWEQVYPALDRAEKRDHIVALHQYGMPDLWGPRNLYDWYIYRLEHQILRRLPFKRLQFAVTETGIDGMIAGGDPRGWRSFMDAGEYTRQLLKSGSYAERFSGRVLGYGVFTLGHFAPWDTYEIEGEVSQSLAVRSDRGTWSDVNTDVTNISPGDFEPTLDPGVEALPDVAPDRTDEDHVIPGDEEPVLARRLDGRFHDYNMAIRSIEERPDHPSGDIVYVIKDVFMTANGSWETTGKPGDVPAWAKDSYLTPEFMEADADRHLFGAVIGLDGDFDRDASITYWSDGFDRLGETDYDGYVTIRAKPESGWANMPMAGSSSFDPDRGESGPWCWMPDGAADVVCGGGLPLNHHVSTFVVWQALRREDWEKRNCDFGIYDLPLPSLSHPVVRRLGFWAPYFRLKIQPLTSTASRTADHLSYVVKDLFAVPIDRDDGAPMLGTVPSWAAKDYLVPSLVGDCDHDILRSASLYAAVRSREGILIPAKEICYARGGLNALREARSDDCIIRYTDAESRWAHLDVGPEDEYRPSREQSGPWCWAPAGAMEAVNGGGLPFGKRVSVFAVWEPVPERP